MPKELEGTNHADECSNCRYFKVYDEDEKPDEDDEEDTSGYCRRYPPQLVVGLGPVSLSPEVSAEYWCGEYMPK